MRMLRPQSTILLFALLACGPAAMAGANAGPRDEAPAATPAPPAPPPPATACWAMTGPHFDGRETYFDAFNNCASPHHCRVWVNLREPPYQVHLEARTSARIDVGRAVAADKFSGDCVPVALDM